MRTHFYAFASLSFLVLVTGCGAGADGSTGESSSAVTEKCGARTNGSEQGVDVSQFQGNFNFASAHVSFAYARISDGDGVIDPDFGANWSHMKSAGVLRGAYQFFRPNDDITTQANLMVEKVGRLGEGDMPPVIDVEVTGGKSGSTIGSDVKKWLEIVEAGTGRKPMIYAGSYFWQDSVGDTGLGSYPFWIAAYDTACPSLPPGWSNWTMWQYSDGGGHLDHDVFNGTSAELKALAGIVPPPPVPLVDVLSGDFNGDGKSDVALTGGKGWDTIPVAFSNGDGSFHVTNDGVSDLPEWALSSGAKAVTGDFDGDGKTDIALTGGKGWDTIPVAFSKGNGFFHITNVAVSHVPGWATSSEAKAITGDFDGDGKTDIALTGVSGWDTIPIAFSEGNGSFRVTNLTVSHVPGWAASADVTPVTGDFDGDGKTDIALTGGHGWDTIPIAFSNGDGSFRVTNLAVSHLPEWATSSGAKPVVGDFDGDGKTDIALTGGHGWDTIPIAFSNGNGSFHVTNLVVAHLPLWALSTNARPVAGDFNGDGKADIGLTGVKGWDTLPVAFSNGNGSFHVTNVGVSSFPGWAAE